MDTVLEAVLSHFKNVSSCISITSAKCNGVGEIWCKKKKIKIRWCHYSVREGWMTEDEAGYVIKERGGFLLGV